MKKINKIIIKTINRLELIRIIFLDLNYWSILQRRCKNQIKLLIDFECLILDFFLSIDHSNCSSVWFKVHFKLSSIKTINSDYFNDFGGIKNGKIGHRTSNVNRNRVMR